MSPLGSSLDGHVRKDTRKRDIASSTLAHILFDDRRYLCEGIFVLDAERSDFFCGVAISAVVRKDVNDRLTRLRRT